MIAPPPGPHGGDGPRLAQALGIDPSRVLDLSASVNPVAPDIRPVAARHLDRLRAYPDPGPATAMLARAIGVDAHRLLLTNGAAEAIALVAAHVGRGSVEDPEFSLYRRHLPVVDPAGPRWRSNPHNPSGRLAPAEEEAAVWDEAFWPLSTGTWTRGDADHGAIVIGSLTKLFACPGLRIGYVLAPDAETTAAIGDIQPRWALSGLAAAVLPELVAGADLEGWCEQIKVLRTELARLLEKNGLEPEPSDANWVLAHAPDLREHLAGHAIAVRDCTSFGRPGTVRIAVPDQAGLDRLAQAL
jgi:histidinol-phosphate/aromatic aminotransferase/cobyric acid decarboxylase-like protein